MNYPALGSKEELALVKRFIIMPFVLKVLDHDIGVMQRSTLKMPSVYERVLKGIQDQVLLEMVITRRMMKERGVHVYEQRKTDTGIRAKYICRGYHHDFALLWGLVRAEVETTLQGYVKS